MSLVSNCQGKKQVHLKLVAEHPSGNDNRILDPLLAGTITGQPIALTPYWDNDREATLYLKGEHSVSVLDGGPHQINYNLAFSISQAS